MLTATKTINLQNEITTLGDLKHSQNRSISILTAPPPPQAANNPCMRQLRGALGHASVAAGTMIEINIKITLN